MTNGVGKYVSRITVLPPTALNLSSRLVGEFQFTSLDNSSIEASSTHPDAAQLFQSDAFFEQLDRLSWDLVWEQQVAVEFAPALGGRHTVIDEQGLQTITMGVEDRMVSNPENPRYGLMSHKDFDLLQRVRDHLIQDHISGGDPNNLVKLNGNAAVILAVEHFIKGVINQHYAMAEFYLVAETIWKQVGGRHSLDKLITKANVDKITQFANDGELDQRHAPKNPANLKPLPPNVVKDAAAVARDIIVEFAKGIV